MSGFQNSLPLRNITGRNSDGRNRALDVRSRGLENHRPDLNYKNLCCNGNIFRCLRKVESSILFRFAKIGSSNIQDEVWVKVLYAQELYKLKPKLLLYFRSSKLAAKLFALQAKDREFESHLDHKTLGNWRNW